jgi:signal transduction histidine kinase
MRDGKVGSVCRDFYSGLRDREGSVTCPWGVSLRYARVENPLGVYGLFAQSGHSGQADAARERDMRRLPRKEKKAQTDAVRTSAQFGFPETKESNLLSDFVGLVSTLLAGRTADAIRTVAHEIQSPIQGALGDALFLLNLAEQEQLPGSSAERVRRLIRNLDAVTAYSRRIPLLIATDLDYHPAQLRRVPLVTVTERVISQLSSFAESRGIEIKRRHRGQPTVEAVPDHLEMVLHNLIHNAIKYSFKTEGQEQHVMVRVDQKGDAAEISVENVGPPITREEIDGGDIFRFGYRGRYSNDRGRQGTGSGMYIANRVIRGHGGTIMIDSRQLVEHPDTPASRVQMIVRWPTRSQVAAPT